MLLLGKDGRRTDVPILGLVSSDHLLRLILLADRQVGLDDLPMELRCSADLDPVIFGTVKDVSLLMFDVEAVSGHFESVPV